MLVLEEADWAAWLDSGESNAAGLLRPAPDGTLRSWPLSLLASTRHGTTVQT
jgi:putative SOS response-associated peptidase YedK